MTNSVDSLGMTKAWRAWLTEKQDGKCCWCARSMKEDATDEHLIPRSKHKKWKGEHSPQKYRMLAHVKCNSGRKNAIAPKEMLDQALTWYFEWEIELRRRAEEVKEFWR